MKVLVSSCVMGNNVRWNGKNKKAKDLQEWADKNSIVLVPVCPEDELFGTPRSPINLVQIEDKIESFMGAKKVTNELKEKSMEIFDRNPDAVGFIGMFGSPSCGISIGVKKAGKFSKGMMHKVSKVPTDDSRQMKNPNRRDIFLERVKKYERR